VKPKRETTRVGRGRRLALRLCLFPACSRNGDHARGLCESHYRTLKQYEADGVVVVEKLERAGKVAPKRMTFKDWLLS
jgi:hypothetical protein